MTAAAVSTAWISDDGTYRYWLARTWLPSAPRQVWIMANPSTADAAVDDPTIRLCMKRARAAGCGGIEVVNLFAYRTKSPMILQRARRDGVDAEGPENRRMLAETIARVAVYDGTSFNLHHIVCAWGALGAAGVEQAAFVEMCARNAGVDLYALRLTTSGQPGHPLYVPLEIKPFVWRARA